MSSDIELLQFKHLIWEIYSDETIKEKLKFAKNVNEIKNVIFSDDADMALFIPILRKYLKLCPYSEDIHYTLCPKGDIDHEYDDDDFPDENFDKKLLIRNLYNNLDNGAFWALLNYIEIKKRYEELDMKWELINENVYFKIQEYIKENCIYVDIDMHRNLEMKSTRKVYPWISTNQNKRKGVCIIVSNEINNRPGTKFDEDKLWRTFHWLGFSVKLYRDLTVESLRENLIKESKQLTRNSEVLVIFILTHGCENGELIMCDENKIKTEDIQKMFDVPNCPVMADRGKILFFVSCRGKEMNIVECVENEHAASIEALTISENPEPIISKDDLSTDDYLSRIQFDGSKPEKKNFLLCFSTTQGNVSSRDITKGTIYIQKLCEIIDKYPKEQVEPLLKRLNRLISNELINNKTYQVPVYNNTLSLDVSFWLNGD